MLPVADNSDNNSDNSFIRIISAYFSQSVRNLWHTTIFWSISSAILKRRVILYQSAHSQCVCTVTWYFTYLQQCIFYNKNFFGVWVRLTFPEICFLIVYKTYFNDMFFLIVAWSSSDIIFIYRNDTKCWQWRFGNDNGVTKVYLFYSVQRWFIICDSCFQDLLNCRDRFVHDV